ncbi:MAG: response regulator [Planctomycetales bacterium]|nr:response regulator [Planctomycetales bacterium]
MSTLKNRLEPRIRVRQPKLLVIDDEPYVIDAIKRRLHDYRVHVMEGYHGLHGIWRGITEKPDAIITDIMMPHASGEEVIACLQHNPKTESAPIIVLTGCSDPALESRLRRQGIAAYLTKPVELNLLVSELSKHVLLRRRD